jgi:hypothetical protein
MLHNPDDNFFIQCLSCEKTADVIGTCIIMNAETFGTFNLLNVWQHRVCTKIWSCVSVEETQKLNLQHLLIWCVCASGWQREGGGEKLKLWFLEGEGEREKEREREWVSVCVCVCVREREREREREMEVAAHHIWPSCEWHSLRNRKNAWNTSFHGNFLKTKKMFTIFCFELKFWEMRLSLLQEI